MPREVVERAAGRDDVDEPEQRRAQLPVARGQLHRPGVERPHGMAGGWTGTPRPARRRSGWISLLERLSARRWLTPRCRRSGGRIAASGGVARSIASQLDVAGPLGLVDGAAAAQAEQPLGVQQVDDDREVDDEADDLQRRPPVDDLVDLEREQDRRGQERQVLGPALRAATGRPPRSPRAARSRAGATPTARSVPERSENSLSSSCRIPTWPGVLDRAAGDSALKVGEDPVVGVAQAASRGWRTAARRRRARRGSTKWIARSTAISRSTTLSRSALPRSGTWISSRSGGCAAPGAGGARATQLSQRRQRCQRTVAVLADDQGVLRPDLGGVEADERVAVESAGDELPVDLAPRPRVRSVPGGRGAAPRVAPSLQPYRPPLGATDSLEDVHRPGDDQADRHQRDERLDRHMLLGRA